MQCYFVVSSYKNQTYPNTYLLSCCSSKTQLSRDDRGDFDHYRHRTSARHLLLTRLRALDHLALRSFFLSCQCKWC